MLTVASGRFLWQRSLDFSLPSSHHLNVIAAPEHFQKRMTKILDGGVLCLIDDVCCMVAALERNKGASVTLSRFKCTFQKNQVKFLGHVVRKKGIQADPDETKAINEMEKPKSVPELRRFMGIVTEVLKQTG